MFVFRDFSLLPNQEIRLALKRVYGVGFRKANLVTAKIGLAQPYYLNKINNYRFYVLSLLLRS